MSYYKDEPAPPKRSAHERIDAVIPKFYEPTYKRADITSHWPEWLHWGIIGAILFALIAVFAGWGEGVYPTHSGPEPLFDQPAVRSEPYTQQEIQDGCADPNLNIICPGDPDYPG